MRESLALGHALTFVHAKSVCAAPDAALAFADVLYAFDEDNESVDSVAVFGRELSTQMRIEPAVALMDLDRVVSEGDEFQVIAGTANAHLAEAGLGPRLAPCVVARLEADAPKASRVRAFGPSQYASSAVCRLTPVEEALAAELDERAAKVFQRGDGEGFRDDDQWAKHALRAHLRDVLDRLAACPLVPGPEEGDVVADREFAGDLARRHGGPFVAAFLDTAPAVRFLAQRNPALADWLAVADAPTLARSFDPSLADRIGLCALARAGSDQGPDRRRRAGQRPEGPHERRGSINQCRRWPPRALPAHGRGLPRRRRRRGGRGRRRARRRAGRRRGRRGLRPADSRGFPAAAAAVRQPERRGPRRVAVARSPERHHGEGADGVPGCRRLGSGQGRADAARRLLPAQLLDGQRGRRRRRARREGGSARRAASAAAAPRPVAILWSGRSDSSCRGSSGVRWSTFSGSRPSLLDPGFAL